MRHLTGLPPFPGFLASTPVVPQLYWDVYSSEQRWKEICRQLGALCDYADKLNINIGINADNIKELEKQFEKFKESGFIDYYQKLLLDWMNENMWCVLSWSSRAVWFGISDDGYFTAYVPDNMNFLDFDVILDAESPDYGKLLLSYCQEVYEPCQITCWDADCKKPELEKEM